jgi:hypothetical protein
MTRRLATRMTMAAVVITGVNILCACLATAQTPACRSLNFSQVTPFVPVPITVPPPRDVLITLPVVVHYMKSTDPRHAPVNDLQRVFSESVLVGLFESKTANRVTVNAIWRPAKIRLALHRAEQRDYNPADFEIPSSDKEEIPSPMAGQFGGRLFNRVNGAFNAPDVPGLDLYLWMDIKAGLAGYGASHRQSDHRIGAAWVDKGCLSTLGRRCAVLVAHEIGHFLGLCHSCESSLTDSGTCTVCLPSGTQVAPPCGQPKNFLMRAFFDGTGLTGCEVGQARLKAAERLKPQ